MPRSEYDRNRDRYGRSFDRAYEKSFGHRRSLDQGRIQMDPSENQDFFDGNTGRDYEREASFERGTNLSRSLDRNIGSDYDRNFGERSLQDEEREHLPYEGFSTGRDFMTNRPYGPYGPESFEQGRGDYYRSHRWGGESRMRGEHYGKGPKGWKRSDDRIKEEASEALYHDPRIDASDFEVSVKDSVITLKGMVDDRDTKRAAERCVEDLTGVEDVQNELRIRQESERRPTQGKQSKDKLS